MLVYKEPCLDLAQLLETLRFWSHSLLTSWRNITAEIWYKQWVLSLEGKLGKLYLTWYNRHRKHQGEISRFGLGPLLNAHKLSRRGWGLQDPRWKLSLAITNAQDIVHMGRWHDHSLVYMLTSVSCHTWTVSKGCCLSWSHWPFPARC